VRNSNSGANQPNREKGVASYYCPFIEKLDQRCLALAAAAFPDVAKPLDDSIYTFEPGQGYFYSAKGKRKNETLRLVFDALIKKID
jgi:hypothetical protein